MGGWRGLESKVVVKKRAGVGDAVRLRSNGAEAKPTKHESKECGELKGRQVCRTRQNSSDGEEESRHERRMRWMVE